LSSESTRTSFLSLLALLVLVCGVGVGQTLEKGAVSGTVFDPSGAVIPGADVTVIHASTGAERTLISDAAGRFRADILPAGEYLIEVSMPGFARTIVEGVVLSIGQELIEDVTLQLEAVGQEITVQSGTGRMDTSETRVNTAINNEYVENLPISGRDFRDFANAQPCITRRLCDGVPEHCGNGHAVLGGDGCVARRGNQSKRRIAVAR